MFILRSIYNELKKEHEALKHEHSILNEKHKNLVQHSNDLRDEFNVHRVLVDDMLDFIKKLEPSKAKGAAEMRAQRDALVAKVEQAMKGESDV